MSAPELDLVAAFHRVFGVPTWVLPRDVSPAAFEDGDALIRSRGGLSRGARRLSRRPWVPRVWEPWADETARALGDYREEAS